MMKIIFSKSTLFLMIFFVFQTTTHLSAQTLSNEEVAKRIAEKAKNVAEMKANVTQSSDKTALISPEQDCADTIPIVQDIYSRPNNNYVQNLEKTPMLNTIVPIQNLAYPYVNYTLTTSTGNLNILANTDSTFTPPNCARVVGTIYYDPLIYGNPRKYSFKMLVMRIHLNLKNKRL